MILRSKVTWGGTGAIVVGLAVLAVYLHGQMLVCHPPPVIKGEMVLIAATDIPAGRRSRWICWPSGRCRGNSCRSIR